uniref:Large ribosomal subunit protein uL4 n=1 Tax=uncultured Ignavibacteria bacterium Rifle_16ft_4_minimus_28285 TaxID=1665101 RepID=A0A0H4TML1_9BACT|nr:Ribosomal protein L4, large subunit ribosomal protein L4 [uncultured Ignavibacteria bacterium Rifle_16ft_4_minimus_28285]
MSYKAKDSAITVVEDFSFDQPKTKEMVSVLKAFSLGGKKILLLTSGKNDAVLKSGRNIPSLSVRDASTASTYEIVNTNMLLIQKSALSALQNSLKN